MKTYHFNGETFTERPNIVKTADGRTISPIKSDEIFEAIGGTITDDGEPTPKQRVCNSFRDLIIELAGMTDKITPAEFLAAAANGISADLIALAEEKQVDADTIDYGRKRITEIMADAMRFGMTWNELIGGINLQGI